MKPTLQDRIVAAALRHVPIDGWTLAALAEGAADEGLSSAAVYQAFPGGVPEAVEHFSRRADERMLASLKTLDLEGMRVRDRIATAVRIRLEQNAANREAIRRALSFLALPMNGGRGRRSLYRTVDAMWRAAGDTATDFNFYTKRGLLAAVYVSTLLYWLDDNSDGFEATWGFLDRRIGNVMQIPKAQSRLKKGVKAGAKRLACCLTAPLSRISQTN
jgi:ubiquinone biosynthesis protein COQ9